MDECSIAHLSTTAPILSPTTHNTTHDDVHCHHRLTHLSRTDGTAWTWRAPSSRRSCQSTTCTRRTNSRVSSPLTSSTRRGPARPAIRCFTTWPGDTSQCGKVLVWLLLQFFFSSLALSRSRPGVGRRASWLICILIDLRLDWFASQSASTLVEIFVSVLCFLRRRMVLFVF